MALKIIAYHGVCKNHSKSLMNFDGKHLFEKDFEKQLVFFKKNFSVLSAIDLQNCFLKKSLPKKALLLTFDDAYLNFFENAFPLLDKHSMPAVLFVPTGLIGKAKFLPQDLLLAAVEKSKSTATKKEKLLNYFELKKKLFEIQKNKGQKNAFEFVESETQKLGFEKNYSFEKAFSLLNWHQLKELSSSGLVEVGSHTVSHIPLFGLREEKIKKELLESKKIIEKKTKHECFCFAYPFGSFGAASKKIAKENFFFSFTTKFGSASLHSDRELLPRISLNNNYNTLFPLTISVNIPQVHSDINKRIFSKFK